MCQETKRRMEFVRAEEIKTLYDHDSCNSFWLTGVNWGWWPCVGKDT